MEAAWSPGGTHVPDCRHITREKTPPPSTKETLLQGERIGDGAALGFQVAPRNEMIRAASRDENHPRGKMNMSQSQDAGDRYREARRRVAGLRVCLVHDWLLGMRGGERVLEALLQLFPRAEVLTLFYDPRAISNAINCRPIHPSPLSNLPWLRSYYRQLLPLLPLAASRLKVPHETDLVISTSHCVAHGVRCDPSTPHLTYCFSPMRYLYDEGAAYARGGAGIWTGLLKLIAPSLRRWDAAAAKDCTAYWAISDFVASRIRNVYGLESHVLHPPVLTDFFTPRAEDGGRGSDKEEEKARAAPYLLVSALSPYKRVDVAIEAANALGKELWIVGDGPMNRRLRRIAGPTVSFLGWVEDDRLRELYRDCRGLIFPGEEDFGLVPLEAMACARPVLALRCGGAIETVREGVTGAFFDVCDSECLRRAWERFDPGAYDPEAIRRHAAKFGVQRFMDEFALQLAGFLDALEPGGRGKP